MYSVKFSRWVVWMILVTQALVRLTLKDQVFKAGFDFGYIANLRST